MKWSVIILLLAFGSLAFAQNDHDKKYEMTEDRLEGQITAPEFADGLEWLNVDHPITLEELSGKIVLLDFWTFCCINCIHIIPDLKKLEEKYVEELVVIGVHSAKFTNEQGTDQIRQAILRYEITHPVVNDRDFKIWRSYGVRSWPTLVLINPHGKIIASKSGENIFDPFDSVIRQAIDHFDAKGELNRDPFLIELEMFDQTEKFLSFPGKIKSDLDTNTLIISDSNHNRILITDPDGKILDEIGSGEIGQDDGTFENATFNHPQGTTRIGDLIYIADTENHLIRVANVRSRQVKTIIGTGKQAIYFNVIGQGRKVPLNSPWDLVYHDRKLYIAMAGFHQLWIADLKTMEAKPHAGTGRESNVDGILSRSALAQPSGIAIDGEKLYFADSETSSIRSADIHPKGEVKTIIGKGLFDFGDIDGDHELARLQHPLGVAISGDQLYVADTYNSKIKIIDPKNQTSKTYAGIGTHGLTDGDPFSAQFNEPSGLTILGDQLYVADTNNHQIRVIDLQTGIVRTLEIQK